MPTRDLSSVAVLVVALTYRRPDDLAALMPALVAQRNDMQSATDILIVDNDPDAGARRQVEEFGRGIRYLHAPEPGIAAARNAALAAAHGFDVLVFIDDDERPSDHWLRLLLETWAPSGAAAVVGPVVSSYVVPLDRWIEAGRFFERRRMPTGTVTDVAATNNLLLDMAVLRRLGLRFDERFGLIGGEDTLFTRQLHAAGGRLVWCDEATVTDVVPAARTTRDWVLRRAFRSGNSLTLTSLALADDRPSRLRERGRAVGRGLPRLAAGAGGALLGTLTRRIDLRARGMRTAARGAGMLAGVVGPAYVEYRR